MRTITIALLVAGLTALAGGCGGKSKSSSSSGTAATSSGATTAPTTTNTPTAPTTAPGATPAPSPSPSPSPSAGTGSGGTGGPLGLTTRTVTTQAQAGLPATSIDYDVYVPNGVDPATPAPLLVAGLMGLTPWRAIADAEAMIVIDFRDHDRNGGFNFNYDVLGLQAILIDVQSAWNVDTKRIYYHGFSAAAHWGYTIVLANANAFAGLGISAGSLQIATQQGVWPGNVQRLIPVAIRHGNGDTVVPVQSGRDARTALMGAGHPVDYTEFNGGHTIADSDAAAVWAFLRTQRAP
jgi:predicted esterase